MRLENAGHSTAVSRATSYFSPTAYYNELTGGTAYYHFLEQLEKNYDSQKNAVAAKLKEVAAKLFTRSNMMISYKMCIRDRPMEVCPDGGNQTG